MQKRVSEQDIRRIVNCEHHHPASILGPHAIAYSNHGTSNIAIRAYNPAAKTLYVLPSDKSAKPVEMAKRHADGFYEAEIKTRHKNFRYQFRAIGHNDAVEEYHDPYRFPSLLSEEEKQLFLQGQFYHMYRRFGAHVIEIDGVAGVNFVVWAPNATRVSVIGNFNSWDGRYHPMNVHAYTGIWELFIPRIGEHEIYKYEIRTANGALRIKADPIGFASELRPSNASKVHRIGQYKWHDKEWMARREKQAPYDKPMAIYEVHLGSWKRKAEENNRPLNYRELADELADYVKDMGYTHIELMPVAEHPYDGSWGYQVTGYFAPTSRYGAPDDFKYFVDHMHANGIGVIVDWVPAHFPRDDFALRRFDGTALYEHDDPRLGEHPDWGTLIFNYGRYEVTNFLIANAIFWLDEYHVDGLRVDAVASMLYLDYSREEGQWLPNKYGGRENLEAIEFLKKLNESVYAQFPNVLMVAEESTSWPSVSRPTYLGGLGFNLKWNMGWMNDFLEYIEHDPIHRKFHHNKVTFSMWYAFTENFVLVLSHDEVVHGKASLLSKMPGDRWQMFANLKLTYGFMYGHPGKKLLFMGGEFGQWREWSEKESLDWHLLDYPDHRNLQKYVRDLNHVYRQNPSLWELDFTPEGFQWIDFQDADSSILVLMRKAKDPEDFTIILYNFTPVPRHNYMIGVPVPGFYREALNSDAEVYGGSNLGNKGGVEATDAPYHQFDHSIAVTVPPLAVVMFQLQT